MGISMVGNILYGLSFLTFVLCVTYWELGEHGHGLTIVRVHAILCSKVRLYALCLFCLNDFPGSISLCSLVTR